MLETPKQFWQPVSEKVHKSFVVANAALLEQESMPSSKWTIWSEAKIQADSCNDTWQVH